MIKFFDRKIFRQVLTVTILTLLTLPFMNCSGTTSSVGSPSYSSPTVPVINGLNVMSITVGCGYVNQPCVSVKICAPGSTTNCQTISDLLLDTGSVGIRIFSSAVNSSVKAALPAVTNASSLPYGACAVYGDGSYQWGPLVKADVVMGQMPAVNMPIELVDFTFGDTGTKCKQSNANAVSQDAAFAGYNGIVGIEYFMQDCGAACAATAYSFYYACSGATCNAATIPTNKQLQNPIGAQATDNNGYYIQLPTVTSSGAQNPTGYLVFGINSQSNNSTGNLSKVLLADPANGHIQTTYNGTNYTLSIIDSGSNANYFPSTISTCASPLTAFYCPGGPQSLTAIQKNYTGSVSSTVNFTVTNADQMYSPGNAFSTLAGPAPSGLGGYFDWGLPFFFGRTVWAGMEGRTATIGVTTYTGPYWAY